MGHIRLGIQPKSKAWKDVVGLIVAGADVPQVAHATIAAAEHGFSYVLNDKGYTDTVWLMTQMAIAAKKQDILGHLESIGLAIPRDATLPDIAAAISDALEHNRSDARTRSALGTLAGRALIGAVIDVLSPKVQTLFSSDPDTLKAALYSLGKQKQFGDLSRQFYSRLANEYLQYHLKKVVHGQLGEGMRFATMNQVAQFDAAMTTHCWEASRIVEQFSSEWLSKHRWEEGGDISRESSDGFASYALKKMKDALRPGAQPDAR